jgi:hypothetical protein
VVGGLWHLWGKKEIYTGICWEGPKCIVRNLGREAWT